MKKKIIVFCMISIFMLMAISYATAVNNTDTKQKKISPLFRFRTLDAIEEKRENLKSRFIGNRLFYLPMKVRKITRYLGDLFYSCTDCPGVTCQETMCILDKCTIQSGCTYKTCDYPTEVVTCPGSGWTCNTFGCCPS